MNRELEDEVIYDPMQFKLHSLFIMLALLGGGQPAGAQKSYRVRQF